MLEHVLPPYVSNNREARPYVNDVGKILVRGNSQIDAARLYLLLQLIDDEEIGSLIGYEVVGIEVPFGFRPLIDVAAELFDRDFRTCRRARLFVTDRYRRGAQNQEQRE